ncbi:MAG: hypothetical protein PHN45_07480 [Methylococcales bacterium]|nr:hypothetical protein [Methylococcales bacterium]MDD5754575.1 hypothetical protein [Methylococcales bacterium]
MNKYGCTPTPDDEILSFSSSTATTISNQDFAIADEFRTRLDHALKTISVEQLHFQEITRQKNEWRELIGLANETPLIFSPSGTDLHGLVASQIASNTLIIMAEGNETGSGIEVALKKGGGIEIVSIALRSTDGLPRTISEIDAEVIELVQHGVEQQRDVLLVLIDQSKTGMIAPSSHCAIQLKNQYETRLNVLVDACQFRLSATTLKAYLQHNFMIALTGSKFLAAPSFSAILILPPTMTFPIELEEPNFGLMLRMEIALNEYRAFYILTDAQIQTIISDFSKIIQNYLISSPYFEPLETPILNREGLINEPTWDCLPTIFPFMPYRDNQPFSRIENLAIYQQLPQQNPRCQIGQPVICGNEKSALRLCLSSRLIVEAAKSEQHCHDMIHNALRVLATLETLIQFDSIKK